MILILKPWHNTRINLKISQIIKMYKHLRGKSDTNFVIDKLYLDNIHYNIKNFTETDVSLSRKPKDSVSRSNSRCKIYTNI